MPQVRLVKLKFKPGKKQIWRDWCEQLKQRVNEVVETLKNEGTLAEACFVSQDGESVYYFMEVEDLAKTKKAFKNSAYKIDKDHREAIIASLEKIEEMNTLFYFRNK